MESVRLLGERIVEELGPVASGLEHLVSNITLINRNESDVVQKEFYELLSREPGVDDILAKHELQLMQIRDMNQECIRMANMASTRMSAFQQNMNEDWENVRHLSEWTRNRKKLESTLESMRKEAVELHHYFLQTQLAMEALDRLVKTQ
ncbi:unnamed protein product [Bursaphelenchus xylophilus]|uniref:(pine wood nematode) hypothetical protein n=1 Tax=Bursaphelenchus xylophilus TaxID=6326 RepID=A0A1I7SC11_BURXY|nr:unnamed protein product [Bursaphelenchus xylophilus]CAG9086387.1 unnamed protein product [Bursaphelenchus xylophilus]